VKVLNHPLKVLSHALIRAVRCSSIPRVLSSKMMGLMRFAEIFSERFNGPARRGGKA
jgi:hypothetical protein